jgi:hypothetical protein
MAEFRTEYYTPMDRAYHETIDLDKTHAHANIEAPIIPINQLGITVPEHDPTGRIRNVVEGVKAAMRGGVGNMQIMFTTPIESAIGGRPKAYGKEVREALKEVALAGGSQISGFEMATSLSNFSGWDAQRNVVDEEKRQRDLNEVKEAIQFAAEVAQGGGVDVLSWEYDRPIHRANWWKDDKDTQKAFARLQKEDERKEEVRFIDERSGGIMNVPIRDGIWMFIARKDGGFKEIDPEKGTPVLWTYKDFEEYSKKPGNEGMKIHDFIKKNFLTERKGMAKAQEAYYRHQYEGSIREAEQCSKGIKEKNFLQRLMESGFIPEKEQHDPVAYLKKQKIEAENTAQSYLVGLQEQRKQQMQAEQQIERLKPMEEVALQRSMQSYAEAGITAMQTQDQFGPKNIKKDLYVGPELGWPQYYGSHPQEFVEIIRGAREQMVEILIDSNKCQQYGLKEPMTRSEAKQEAQTHIKGTLDTAHFGMWLQNFHPELPWNDRLKKFNKWYMDEMDTLAKINKKEQIIGAIQAVDSAGAAHGHLPAGQGVFPVKAAVEKLVKDGGFTGYVTSEGHEEEKFGEGRIALKTWQNFNSPISSSYGPGAGPAMQWNRIQNAYMGRTYSPLFMFGSYAPGGDFKLWSEVPLE